MRYHCFLFFLCCCPWAQLPLCAQTDLAALQQNFHRLDSICTEKQGDDVAQVVNLSRQMIDIGQRCGSDTMVLMAKLHQGQALENLGSFDAALKIYYECLALAEKSRHGIYHFQSLFHVGWVYQRMEDRGNSQTFMHRAKQAAIACGQLEDTISVNYEIGFNLVSLGQPDLGIGLIRENLRAARLVSDPSYVWSGIDNLANILNEQGQHQAALDVELELLEMPELWESNLEKTGTYIHLAELYARVNDWGNAQKYQREAMTYAQLVGSNDWLYECYRVQSMIDEGRGEYKSALANHQRYLALKDSVYQTQYDEKMAAMSAVYELESKQKTIALLEKDKQIQQDQLQQQRSLLLLGLLSVGMVLLLIRFFHQRKTQKLREAFAQDLIKVQETERQRISKELHDSVGQNILFIKNHLKRLGTGPDEPLAQSVDLALEEVRSIAKDLYPNQLEQYGLSAAVDSLCELVRESSGVFVSSDLQDIDQRLSREAKINCYRIIQECINNALKHAEATAIRISSSISPGKVELVVQDNGKGFDRNLLERKAVRSFGLLNMEERVKMLRGKFDLETTLSKGVKLTFVFPA